MSFYADLSNAKTFVLLLVLLYDDSNCEAAFAELRFCMNASKRLTFVQLSYKCSLLALLHPIIT